MPTFATFSATERHPLSSRWGHFRNIETSPIPHLLIVTPGCDDGTLLQVPIMMRSKMRPKVATADRTAISLVLGFALGRLWIWHRMLPQSPITSSSWTLARSEGSATTRMFVRDDEIPLASARHAATFVFCGNAFTTSRAEPSN